MHRCTSFLFRVVALSSLLLATLVGACKDKTLTADSSPRGTTSARPMSSQSPDRLAPGELGPGKEKAFGLVLPAAVRVIVREPFRVLCEGRVEPERVANYLRERVEAESVGVGSVRTIFEKAVVKDTKGPRLRIEVVKIEGGTRVLVHDLTPPYKPLLTPEETWKIHGYDGEGKRLDPSKFE